jgi:hypothetical protein
MNTNCAPEFQPFAKIPRLSREILVTEKIDGTNAQIFIGEDGTFLAGSRNRWLTPESDNYGFCKWAMANRDELLKLGPGRHFGEWYGCGIQRGYGLKEKRFSLFNVNRWAKKSRATGHDLVDLKLGIDGPSCCDVVPVLYRGEFSTGRIEDCLRGLAYAGSAAAPGFMQPEGVVIYHVAGGYLFKKTVVGDESSKSYKATPEESENARWRLP